MADVVRLVRESGLPQADISKLLPRPRDVDLSNPEVMAGQLRAALRDADQDVVLGLLHGAYRNGYPVELSADGTIGPALDDAGREWEAG